MPTDPGGNSGASAVSAKKKAVSKVTSTNTAFRNPEASTVDYYKDKRNEYAKGINAQLPGAVDPFNGASLMDLLLHGQHPTPSGGGSHGGGGGGGSSGPSAADIAARNAAIDAMLAQENSSVDTLGQSQHAAFDARNTQLQGIQSGANTRLQGILGGLQQGASQAQGATSQAFANGDQALQGLLAQYTQMAQQRDAQNNGTLGAFGAGSTGPTGSGVQDLIYAGRAANTMRGNAANEMYAQRGNVYNGLGADAQMQNGQVYDSLLAKLAQERAVADQQNAAQKAQYGIQAAQARLP